VLAVLAGLLAQVAQVALMVLILYLVASPLQAAAEVAVQMATLVHLEALEVAAVGKVVVALEAQERLVKEMLVVLVQLVLLTFLAVVAEQVLLVLTVFVMVAAALDFVPQLQDQEFFTLAEAEAEGLALTFILVLEQRVAETAHLHQQDLQGLQTQAAVEVAVDGLLNRALLAVREVQELSLFAIHKLTQPQL
jgi:hypothetical protein